VYHWLIPPVDFWASSFVVMAFILLKHCRAKQCSWDHNIIIAIYVELSQKLIKTDKYQGLLFVDLRKLSYNIKRTYFVLIKRSKTPTGFLIILLMDHTTCAGSFDILTQNWENIKYYFKSLLNYWDLKSQIMIIRHSKRLP